MASDPTVAFVQSLAIEHCREADGRAWIRMRGNQYEIAAAIRALAADAWDAGRAAERRDWELTYDLVTPDEDRQPIPNPYRTEEKSDGGQ